MESCIRRVRRGTLGWGMSKLQFSARDWRVDFVRGIQGLPNRNPASLGRQVCLTLSSPSIILVLRWALVAVLPVIMHHVAGVARSLCAEERESVLPVPA